MKKRIEKLTPEQQFLEYLYEITKNGKLREYGAEFFSIFEENYKNRYLKKEDFDTLKVEQPDGSFITYEQDVVKDLFNKRNQVPYTEVFNYLLKNNIKSFDGFYDVIKPNSVGRINILKQKINIKYAINLQQKDLYCKTKSEDIKNKLFDFSQKGTAFHEFSHVFEIKTYNNHQYCIVGLKDKVLDCKNASNNNKIFFTPNAGYVDETKTKVFELNGDYSPENIGNYYYHKYVNLGKTNIAEIINEDFALRLILKNAVLYANHNNPGSKFIAKRRYGQAGIDHVEFLIPYHKNYDILKLLGFALSKYNYKSVRFNSSKTIREINNFDIDKSIVNLAINEYKRLKLNYDVKLENGENISINANWGKHFDKASIYDLIAYGVGFDDTHNTQNTKDFNYKTISQTLLVSAIKNKTLVELKNKKIKKDDIYFKKLNAELVLIDKFLLYKNAPIDNKDIYPFEVYSVEKMSEKYKDNLYSQQFVQLNQLINEIKKYISALPQNKQTNIKNCMTFFEEQKQLDDTLEEKIQNADELKQAQILPSPDNSSHKKQNELEPTK